MGQGETPRIQDGFPQLSFCEGRRRSAVAGDIQRLNKTLVLRKAESAEKH